MSTVANLNILVTASTGQALAQLARVDAATKKTAASTNAASGAAGRLGVTGKQVAAGGLAALAYGSYKALKASIDFEDAFSNVRKTVEGSDAELDRVASGLRNMTREIPVGVNELANLAAQAGALGVPTGDLLRFTRTAALLGVTTDLSAEDAANALARIGNVMGASGKDFDRMAAALVDLGNKGASTEGEITQMALRFAGVAKQVGLTTPEVLGFSAALANVGEEAEAGGSAMSRSFIEMGNAVGEGGAKLAAFAQVSGVSARAFSREFDQKPAQAMVRFITGLSRIRKEGGNVFQTLDKLGLSEIRVRRAMLALAGSPKKLAEALGISEEAWREMTAAEEEGEKKFDTTKSKIQLLKNAVNDLAISVGDDLRPAFDLATTGMTEFFQGLGRDVDIEEQFGFGALSDSVGEWGEAIGRHFDGIKSSFNSLKGAAVGAVGSIGQSIKNRLGDLGKGAKITIGVGGDAVGQAKRIWSGIKGIASRAINFVLGVAGDAVGRARRIWAQVKSAVSRAIQFVLSLPGVGTLVSAARSIWNAINSALPDITLNIDIPTPNIPDIPGLAKGGRNVGPELARVNERGAELARFGGGGWGMFGGGKPTVAAIPAGTDIFTASETRALLRSGLPGFAGGKEGKRRKREKRLAKREAARASTLLNLESILAAAELTAGIGDDSTALDSLIKYWRGIENANKNAARIKNPLKRRKGLERLLEARNSLKSYTDQKAGLSESLLDSASGEDATLLRELLNQANLRYAVSQAQGGVLRSTPYVGSFAGGGIVPGPMGAPGIAVVHGGEAIAPPPLSGGGQQWAITITNWQQGTGYMRALAGDEAQRVGRRGARGVNRTPGRAGAL